VLLTVARFDQGDRYKGHDTVLAALEHVAGRVPDLDYVIVGDGDDRGRLEGLARQRGLQQRVHFAGQVSDSELLDYYRLANVFVMPSAKEGFGIVFLEAAQTGLPVIGGDRDGSADALADGAIGTLVAPADDAGLAKAIEAALVGSPLGARAQRFARDAFQSHVSGLTRSLADRLGASA
jgi:phosphatidylinositol alpha-1,6-mannosyltransferase